MKTMTFAELPVGARFRLVKEDGTPAAKVWRKELTSYGGGAREEPIYPLDPINPLTPGAIVLPVEGSATLPLIRRALVAEFGRGQVNIYRAPAGYYYFGGLKGDGIPSLMTYSLTGWTVEQVLEHVRAGVAP